MSIHEERARIREALLASPTGPRYAELYAAQQALGWVLDSSAFASPFDMISGTRRGSADCPEYRGPRQCVEICDPAH